MKEEGGLRGYYDTYQNITPDEAKYMLQHLMVHQTALDAQIQQISQEYKKLLEDPVRMLYRCNGDAADQEYARICAQADASEEALQNELAMINKEQMKCSRLAICQRKMPADVYALLQTLVDGIPVKAVCLEYQISRKTYAVRMKTALNALCRLYNSPLDNVSLSLQPTYRMDRMSRNQSRSGNKSSIHQMTMDEILMR